jgi:hypothetical protein
VIEDENKTTSRISTVDSKRYLMVPALSLRAMERVRRLSLQHIDVDFNSGVRPEQYESTPNQEDYGDMATDEETQRNTGT